MTTHSSPDALVRAFIDVLVAKDLDSACAMVSDNCEYDNVPLGKVFGPDGIRGTLAAFFGGCTEMEWIIHRQVSSGNLTEGCVLNERTDRFNMNGRWVELPVCGVFEVKDSHIVLWRDYFDQPTLMKALAPQD